jgi:hypothetical protein
MAPAVRSVSGQSWRSVTRAASAASWSWCSDSHASLVSAGVSWPATTAAATFQPIEKLTVTGVGGPSFP